MVFFSVPGVVYGHGDEHQPPKSSTAPNQSIEEQSNTDNQDVEMESDQEGGVPRKQAIGSTDYRSVERTDRGERTESNGQSEAKRTAPGWFKVLLPGMRGAKNLHPMLVHFPIVFLFTATLFSGLSWFWNSERFLLFARWMFWLGLIALPVTAATGFWVVGGWGDGHVTGHRNFMLLTTLLAFVLLGVLRMVANRTKLYRIVLTVGLIIVLTVMTLGADRGAWLVFVKGSGVKSAKHVHDH